MVYSFKCLVFEREISFFLFFILFGFSVSSYSQSIIIKSVLVDLDTVNTIEQVNVAKSHNYDFVLWFMGSIQDPNNISDSDVDVTHKSKNVKNSILTSGLQPNRILIKAFLKKAVNFETCFS